MPFASSHLSFQKCLQHAFCPDQRLSPLLFGWGLYSLCSRERHCDCQVISIAFLWIIHSCIYLPVTLGSTKLCCLGFIATKVTLTAALVFIDSVPDSRCFVTPPRLLSRVEAWSFVTQFSFLVFGPSLDPGQSSSPFLSRLTFQPFHLQPPHIHFATLASARYCTQRCLTKSIPLADQYK